MIMPSVRAQRARTSSKRYRPTRNRFLLLRYPEPAYFAAAGRWPAEIGAIHLYRALFPSLCDLSPNVALIAGYKADRKSNLYTGPSTEDTPALVETAAFRDGIVIAGLTNWWMTDAICARAWISPVRG